MSSDQEEVRRFEYLPVLKPRQIRLIQVSDDPIQKRLTCEFTSVSLDDAQGRYEAISYCWGDPSPTDKLWVGRNRYVELNSSAAAILTAIAAQKSNRYFWIDAVCIDQKNIADKNQQAPLMGQIYSSAMLVVAWLGSSSEDSDQAMEFIGQLNQSIADLVMHKLPVTMDNLIQSTGYDFPSTPWTALARLLQRPWFQRIWIVQEVVLAVEILVICGYNMLMWKDLADVVLMISARGLTQLLTLETEEGERVQSEGALNIPLVCGMKDLRDQHHPLSLGYNLVNFHNFKATDPRDNIWGLLGMTTDAMRFKEDVNYETPTETVFTMTASKILGKGSSLDILHAAGIGNTRENYNLPSWVPDWSSKQRRTILGSIAEIMLYNASGSTLNSVEIDENVNTITLTGITFDRVERVLPQRPLNAIQNSLEAMKTTKREEHVWLKDVLSLTRSSNRYNDEEGRDQAIWATLSANISFANEPATPATQKDFENFQAWKDLVSGMAQSEDWDQLVFPVERVREAQACVHVLGQFGRMRMYISKEGYFGLGPEGVKEDDRVVVFYGAATPFLIREGQPREDITGRYALVGECYMHGFMQGESLGMAPEQQIVLA